MKHFLFLLALLPLAAFAQTDDDRDNGVVSLAGRQSLVLKSRSGDFVFKPYLFLQSCGTFNWYDDQGLDPAYNQDNVANSGFAVPYAILGFTGKAFGRVNYNLSINAAGSGGEVLQQAWVDVNLRPTLGLRVGKMKTPFSGAYLTTLGETLFPMLPSSLTTTVILPHTLNAVNPKVATGFDVGVQLHGFAWNRMGYEVGLFNGTGSAVNGATKTLSDDWHIPSLLYAARLTYQPFGAMPLTQGSPSTLNEKKMLVGVSGSMNVESESESTNDARLGLEFAMLWHRWYFSGEAYWLHIGFTKRQKIAETYDFIGGYAQAGYFATRTLQLGLRYDFMDRNGRGENGMLNLPAVAANYFIPKCGLKVSAMYQYTARHGHDTQLSRDNDLLNLATHTARVMLQYSF